MIFFFLFLYSVLWNGGYRVVSRPVMCYNFVAADNGKSGIVKEKIKTTTTTENPNMFILRELWTRQSGEPNWRKGTAAREYMLSNQPGIMRTTPILRTRNFPEIPQNPTGQSSR